MYFKKVLVDNGFEYSKGMCISFDYKDTQYVEVIKELHDTYFETPYGRCFYYSAIENIRMGYTQGEKVTVSVKMLYESNIITENVYIDTESDETGHLGYFDLYTDKDGLVCMDGETCEVVSVHEDCITLKNEDGERVTEFVLTFEEAVLSCFKTEIEGAANAKNRERRRTIDIYKEMYKLDEEIMKKYYPNLKEEVSQPKMSHAFALLRGDITHILKDESINTEDAKQEILTMIEAAEYSDEIKEMISLKSILEESNFETMENKRTQDGEELTFQEELDNVIGCMEYWEKRVGEYVKELSELSLSEDECVMEDTIKALEFIRKLPNIVSGACVLAAYAGEDWANRQTAYGFGADSYENCDKYIEGGIKLTNVYGTTDFHDIFLDYFKQNIKPKEF